MINGAYRRLVGSPGSSLAAFGLLFSIVMVVLFFVGLQTRCWDRIAAAEKNAQSFAGILAEHTALTIENADRMLLRAEAIRRTALSAKVADPDAANAALRQLQRSSAALVGVAWTDRSGEVLAQSYYQEPPPRNLSDMPLFIAHRDSAAGRLLIAPPHRSARDGRWLIAVSRRLNDSDGNFAGIVTAVLEQSSLTELYRSIDLGQEGTIILVHRDGTLLAREPDNGANAIGTSQAGGPLLVRYLPASETGSYETISPVDGMARLIGYKAVPGLPLVLAVTYSRSETLAPVYRLFAAFGLLIVLIIAVITFGTMLLVRQANALAANARALASGNARFEAALDNMPHGLSMLDADHRLLVANTRYREIYGVTEAQTKPGTPLKEILGDFETTGKVRDFDIDSFVKSANGQGLGILRLVDGRLISITRTPMQGGGWVATHEDITEKQQAEMLLIEKAAELKRTNDRFDAAISSMSLGLCLFDADKRLVICNSRFQQMYGLPDQLVAPGTPLSQLFEFYAKRGDTRNMTVEQRLELISVQSELNYEPADGRVIHIQRTPTPDGGWVATHEDITVQKRAEQMLTEKAAELEAMNVRFDAALNNMSQGLCMFDAEQRVVVSNARYGEIYHLGRDQIKPGVTLRQIMQFREQQGTNFKVVPDNYLEKDGRAAKEVRELADGRVVAISRQHMPDGGWITTHEDITDRALNEKRIAFLAQHDLLTGLANRALFAEKLEDAAKRLARHGTTFTVLMLDLDRFKNVNDTLGHPAGDRLLVEVAQRLRSSLREIDVLARLGGDEFAIVQENEKNQSEGAIALALRIIGLIEQPFDLDGHRVNVGTSIGIAFAPEHGADAETLLHHADLALYAAKSGGRNDFRVFQPELTEAADIQRSMEGELRDAIDRNEFELHYQPIVDTRTRRISGVETFVRWRHPSRGLLGPERFLPLAESCGLMLPLGEWILQQACLDAAAWPPQIRIAVNISAAQFAKGNLFDVVLCALVDSGLSPERLELEIGDTSLLETGQAAHLLTIRQLKNLGISIVLDDCGTGYSSAKYLAGFPFDKIKIDKAVAQGITSRRDCAAVVASVLALANGLEITTVAKGIESAAQYEAMLAAGVDFAQGYLFGRPVPHSELDLDAAMPLTKSVA